MKVRVPALRGDDPLGFLAAVGLLALSEHEALPPLRLAWDGIASPVASVTGEFASLSELGESLLVAFAEFDERSGVLPGVEVDFPVPVGSGETTDPMRMTPEKMAGWYARADECWHAGAPWLSRWLTTLTGQTAIKSEKRGDVELTPFYAPTGRMSMRGSIFDATSEAVRAVEGPSDALTAWRRTSYAGANFDDRAVRDGAVTTSGEPGNRGAPSPTWLATMGMRFFPMVDGGSSTRTVGWQSFRMYPGFTYRSLVWPTWQPSLDAPGVRVLLAHPALQLTGQPTDPTIKTGETLEALGASAVFGSSRRTLSQGDGPLGPARRLWHAADSS